VDLRQLLYFTTLAETLNFHRAAERLNISQPPLSVAIRKLEEELGAPLFLRGARGVTLTPAGEAALEPARAALAQAEQVRQSVRDGGAGERGRLRVGFVGSAIYALLPRLIPVFRRRYPQVDLVLEEATSIEIARRIHARQLDVGLIRLPLLELTQLDATVVESDELVAAIPTSNPLAQRRSAPLRALAAEPFILYTRLSVLHATILLACHKAGFVPSVAQEAEQVHTILSLVQSGLGVALVPSKVTRYVPDGVRLVRLAEAPRIETGVVLARGAASPQALNFQALAMEESDTLTISMFS
jgi:DNA-binding transcriptional LysR family regulator